MRGGTVQPSHNGSDPNNDASLVRQLSEKIDGLEEALLSRDVIGQAKGILMERLRLTSGEAFEQLRVASQHHNRKLRDLAAHVAETGQWPLDGELSNNNGRHKTS
jgi:AmiR/NasT family two-component response regulator